MNDRFLRHCDPLGVRGVAARVTPSSSSRVTRGAALVAALVAVIASLAIAPGSRAVAADSTVTYTGPPAASSIGLIGDSTLSGVRWFDAYGDLERFSFVFDAESCRRTVERSCWSREQRRADNAITVLQEYSGRWGDVLVMMTGYNDAAGGFGEGVTAIVDEARRQGIGTVVWMTLRTKGVNYEEPLHLANGATYRDANRTLYEMAEGSGGLIQLADWATYSADRPEWFESDGVHLSEAGATAVTSFIAEQVDRVLAGENVTPSPPPWEEIRPGDAGTEVVALQEALVTSGVAAPGAVDGAFGPQTEAAVRALQRERGLPETGVADSGTAAALGLVEPPAAVVAPAPTTVAPPPVATVMIAAPAPETDGASGGSGRWWLIGGFAAAVAWLVARWRRGRIGARPAGRPAQARRSAPASKPSSRPAPRPTSKPSSRPAAKPASRAATPGRPATRGTTPNQRSTRSARPAPPGRQAPTRRPPQRSKAPSRPARRAPRPSRYDHDDERGGGPR